MSERPRLTSLEWLPKTPAAEAIAVWALVIGFLGVFKVTLGAVLPWGGSITGTLAVALFVWAPTAVGERRGRVNEDDGLRFDHWRQDVLFALVVMAVVFPLFVGGFRAFLSALDAGVFPQDWVRLLTPYRTPADFDWRAPPDLLDKVGGNIAVAIGEEFFYRGYMQGRFLLKWPAGKRVLGGPLGTAIWVQSAFFAVGHLLTPAPFRLATFFPGLLFGWMAGRSGRVIAPAIVHASSNLLMATLEASAFPH